MAEADRISSLPRDIKISILSRVDLQSAVRTSALAHSLRHLWTFLPCLRLAYNRDCLGDSDNSEGSTDWLERVRRLVSSLRGPLLFFELQMRGPMRPRDARSLPSVHPPTIHLPPFHSLRVLRLWRCHVILPPGFRHLAISPIWACVKLKSPILISISSSIHPIT